MGTGGSRDDGVQAAQDPGVESEREVTTLPSPRDLGTWVLSPHVTSLLTPSHDRVAISGGFFLEEAA